MSDYPFTLIVILPDAIRLEVQQAVLSQVEMFAGDTFEFPIALSADGQPPALYWAAVACITEAQRLQLGHILSSYTVVYWLLHNPNGEFIRGNAGGDVGQMIDLQGAVTAVNLKLLEFPV